MIDNDGNPIDNDPPTIDNYGVPIDYNCHACDSRLSWLFGDWYCVSCESFEEDDEDTDSEDLDPN
jgi:hypothetical protein